MAIVMTRSFPGAVVNIHDDCLIKDPAEIKRRLNICTDIICESLKRQAAEATVKENDGAAR